MLRSNDGSLYHRESVAEALEAAFAEREWPNLSHILGSDWGANLRPPRDPEDYRAQAEARADLIYGTY